MSSRAGDGKNPLRVNWWCLEFERKALRDLLRQFEFVLVGEDKPVATYSSTRVRFTNIQPWRSLVEAGLEGGGRAHPLRRRGLKGWLMGAA